MPSTTSPNDADDGDTTDAPVLGFKGETQINDQLTGFGQWNMNSKATVLNLKVLPKTKPVLHLQA